ncbi:hypothetical protein BOTBODRAFT_37150 [Botryobasidium botryosum FD-172 SS1]|uniref:Glucose receptor Git3 N-terminal domain-containing protein n=1 Tax=Botryobasidium botryosum (strain FD-172 SS1) TaxID=930990 RepID=A0A067MCB9_BOTB1|nr:hypothetical protein BOTBODRAFT_37150 [Botryobasidium botryosum FD-172 SS1]
MSPTSPMGVRDFLSAPSLAATQSSGPPLSEFGPRLGVVFIVQAGIISAVAVIYVLSYKLVLTARYIVTGESRWTHVGIYFVNLMVADAFLATGDIMNARWVSEGAVIQGDFCKAQAIFKQFGDTGVALSTLAITIHTFVLLFFNVQMPSTPIVPSLVIVLIWLIVGLAVGIGSTVNPQYYAPTGYWCWIQHQYVAGQYASEYAWMWFTALVNIVLYVPLYFRLRGNITVGGRSIRWRWLKSSQDAWNGARANEASAAARKMLWYPVAYVVMVLPISAVRFRAFYSYNVPYQATFFCDVLLGLSGAINATLYTLTRPALRPHPRPASHHRRNTSDITTVMSENARGVPRSSVTFDHKDSQHREPGVQSSSHLSWDPTSSFAQPEAAIIRSVYSPTGSR